VYANNRAYGLIRGAVGTCSGQMNYTAVVYARQYWGISIPR
jgi:hypothetical protein